MRHIRVFGLAFFSAFLFHVPLHGQWDGYEVISNQTHWNAGKLSTIGGNVNCHTGKIVINGGYMVGGPTPLSKPLTVITNKPLDQGGGWYVTLWGEDYPSLNVTVYAICVNSQQGGGTVPTPSPQPQPTPTKIPRIAGNWVSGSTSITIKQNGNSFTASFSGSTYNGYFEPAGTIWVAFSKTCCRGTLVNTSRINWSNNTSWTKR